MDEQYKEYPPLLLHLPADLADEVDSLCEANYMSRTDFLVMALKLYAELYDTAEVRAGFVWADNQGASALSDDDDEQVLFAAEDE
jgi:hypothetical protein